MRGSSEAAGEPLAPEPRIQLGRRLGRGGAGEVFDALWPGLGRVAVKVLLPSFAEDPAMLERMRLEAAALARVRHPNVVRLLGAGRLPDGRLALALPRLVGRTVRRALDDGARVRWRDAAALVVAVLEGLAAAHDAGVVHRDVKPSNVFVGHEAGEANAAPRPIVIDFGLARLDGRRSAATTSSSVVGSPAYVAPEQILGGRQDARTDVYAAGVLLFELLAGVPPFVDVDPSAVLEAHVLTPPPALRGVPAAVARCVDRALRKSPPERFPSAAAFAEALRGLLDRGLGAGGRS